MLLFVLRRNNKDRSLFVGVQWLSHAKLTEDYAAIISNICAYCDLCECFILSSRLVSYMKTIDFSRVIEYYIHLNNTSITPILLTSIQHLVASPLSPHSQDVSQPSQLQSALIYLVLARCNDSCRNEETVASLVASIRQLLTQRPAVVTDLLDRLFGAFSVPQYQLPVLLDVLRDVLPADIPVQSVSSAGSSPSGQPAKGAMKGRESTAPAKGMLKGSDYADVTASLQTLALMLTAEQQADLLKVLKKVLRRLAKSNLAIVFWRALCHLNTSCPAVFGGEDLEAWVVVQLQANPVSALVVEAIEASSMSEAVKQALAPSRSIYSPLAEEEEPRGVPPAEVFLRSLKGHGEHKRPAANRGEENTEKRPCYASREIAEVWSKGRGEE